MRPPQPGDVPPLRVMLVDDHAVVRAGYRRLIELEPDLAVVGEHADANSAYDALLRLDGALDVLVLDLSMPGRSGLELLRRAMLRWPALQVLVFSMHAGAPMVLQALKAGARGYVTKSSEPELLVDAVRRVARGHTLVSPDVAMHGLDAGSRPPHLELSPREFDVLQHLLQGTSIDDIALTMHLSVKTVANYQSLIRQKLGVANAVELARYGQAYGLMPP